MPPYFCLEVKMSKLFCLTPGLRVLERQMQQLPGYRPRGYGIVGVKSNRGRRAEDGFGEKRTNVLKRRLQQTSVLI